MQWAAEISFRYARAHGFHIRFLFSFLCFFFGCGVLLVISYVRLLAGLHFCMRMRVSLPHRRLLLLFFCSFAHAVLPCKSCSPQSPKTKVHTLLYRITQHACTHFTYTEVFRHLTILTYDQSTNEKWTDLFRKKKKKRNSAGLPNVCGQKSSNNTNRAVVESKEAKKRYTNKQNMNHHSDQQTVHTNFDMSVLKSQRPFRMLAAVPFSQFPWRSFSLCATHSTVLIYMAKSGLVARWPTQKLSYHLICGLVLVCFASALHTSDAHVLFDVHIGRLNLCARLCGFPFGPQWISHETFSIEFNKNYFLCLFSLSLSVFFFFANRNDFVCTE